MNAAEVGDLLARMALVDNRRPPEDDEARKAMILSWLELVGDLNYNDAVQAVRDHYRESREWIMPSDVRHGVARIRQARLDAAGPVEIPEYLADHPAEALAWKQAAVTAIADGVEPQKALGGAR